MQLLCRWAAQETAWDCCCLRELAIEGISCTAGEQGWCLTTCLKQMLSYHMMLEDGT